MARTLAKHGLRLDVDFAFGHVGKDRRHPYIPVSSWVQALDRAGRISDLVGGEKDFGASLEKFWSHFEQAHPNHQFFQSGIDRQAAFPVYLHGDEGTTYKKDGALVISFQTPMGKGTRKSKFGDLADTAGAHLNFVGHAFETRFLIISALKDTRFSHGVHFLVCIGLHTYQVVPCGYILYKFDPLPHSTVFGMIMQLYA